MKVEINTISKNIYDGEAERVTIPTENGYISILDNHQPLTTSASNGVLEIEQKSGEIFKINIRNAIVEVLPTNTIKISADLYLEPIN